MSIFTAIAQYLLNLRDSRIGEGGGGQSQSDIGGMLDAQAANHAEALDWRHSIVDLLKLTGQDSSLGARQEMARELNYPGALDGSESMNEFLHRAVMDEIARH